MKMRIALVSAALFVVSVLGVGSAGCAPQKNERPRVHDSRCQTFQAIFVMQPRQDRGRNDSMAIRDSVAICPREPAERHVGNARTQTGVGSTLVVVRHPLLQGGPKVPFIEHDQPGQTLATN